MTSDGMNLQSIGVNLQSKGVNQTSRVCVMDFITTSPLRHRQRGNMTRPPVPKPSATTTCSPDSPARRQDRQEGEGWAAGA
jgi:hypothetical protein